jgi:hypothetical protein
MKGKTTKDGSSFREKIKKLRISNINEIKEGFLIFWLAFSPFFVSGF